MSRIRNTAYETVHHLTSRIAHGVYFLKESERNDFLDIVKRVTAFSGVELIGWCIMTNHFHLYVYLPTPPDLSDEEVLARYHLLKDDAPRVLADDPGCKTGAEGQTFRASLEDDRMTARGKLVKAIRRRMYSIAEYMRMIKQWFSEDYNDRTGHKGTMWQSSYGDHPFFIPERTEDYTDLRNILAYIHLNPIRGSLTDMFDGYAWSSYTAFRKGDPDAVKAMHLAYRGYDDDAEIILTHEQRMKELLEDWKLEHAKNVARKRAEGYELPPDQLTDECMVAQAAAHAAEVQKELESLHAERDLIKGTKARREHICKEIACVLSLHPSFAAHDIAQVLEVPVRSIQRYLTLIRKPDDCK